MAGRILIVDDDATMVRLLATILEIEGFETREAYSGAKAFEIIHGDVPDLVLLDIMMPELDGFEVLDRLRKDTRTRSMPVIMLTARTETRDIFEGWRRGADGYVTKPFDPRELVDTIKAVMDSSVQERLIRRAQQVESSLQLIRDEGGDYRNR